jgi:NodT family efflux transporter outer membrane factor (OMF) lipoprotein
MTLKIALPALVATLLAGCSFAPHYARPATTTPAQWKTEDGWQPAQPADGMARGPWWQAFGDPVLNDLIARGDAHNQTVAQAAATYAQARAVTREARASLFPTVGLDGSVTHTYSGGSRTIVTGGVATGGTSGGSHTSNNYSVGLDASWTPDLFGSVRNTVANDRFTEQARLADLANARLVLHAELTTDYLSLRAADAQLVSLAATVEAYKRSLQIATNRYNAAIGIHSDVWQAQSQLASAQSDLEGEKRTRAQFEDAIAVFVGEPAPSFAVAAVPGWAPVTPAVPIDMPSTLLERRPDIASAERAVAAANAEIGVAKAAFFPTVSLSGSGGFNSSTISNLFSSASSLWSLGASVAETILDFGARSARVAQTRAAYDAAVANYRQVTLAAFQDVQDQLVAARVLARQEALLREASIAADKSETSLRDQYAAGTVIYTDVVTAQATALAARRALIQAQVDRQNAAVALIQSLGGGWQQGTLSDRTGSRT